MNRGLLTILLLTASANLRAEVRDVAELFPETTLAYAEVRSPAAIAETLAALVQGTPLADSLKAVHDRRDALREPGLFAGQSNLGIALLVASPEFQLELKRFHGAGIGLCGFTKAHEPLLAGAVLTGDSYATGLLIRGYLASDVSIRRIDTVEGVAIFQQRGTPPIVMDQEGKPVPYENPKPTEGPLEATYAYTPGLFAFGSNKAAVVELLTRFRKPSANNLAKSSGFPVERNAGIGFFVRPPELVADLDKARKAKREFVDGNLLGYAKFVLNARAVPQIHGSLCIRPDGIELTINGAIHPTERSVLLDVLDAASPSPTFPNLTKPSALTASLAMPLTDKRVTATMAIADAIAKARGEVGKLPSDWVAEAEKSGLPIRTKLLPGLRQIALVVPPKQEIPVGAMALPTLVLNLNDESSGADWEAALPKWLQLLDAAKIAPTVSSEMIVGTKVFSTQTSLGAVHFARNGTTLAIGMDRKWVANCVQPNPTKTLVTTPGSQTPATTTENASIVAVMTPAGIARGESLGKVRLQKLVIIEPDSAMPPVGMNLSAWTDKELAVWDAVPPIALKFTKAKTQFMIQSRLDWGAGGFGPMIVKTLPWFEKYWAQHNSSYPMRQGIDDLRSLDR